MRFSWSEAKEASNRRKHGVSFAEAAAMFRSGAPILESFDDRFTESRSIAVGPVARGMISVVFVDWDDGVTRIISARFAGAAEVRRYDAWLLRGAR